MGVDVDEGLIFAKDNNESSEKDASNERDASNEHDASIGFESSLGNSRVASDHLHNCIENMELTPFPKFRRKLKLRKQTEKVLNYSTPADCAALCEFPNSYDDMVQCDTKTCQNWFHYKYAGLNSPTDSLLLDL